MASHIRLLGVYCVPRVAEKLGRMSTDDPHGQDSTQRLQGQAQSSIKRKITEQQYEPTANLRLLYASKDSTRKQIASLIERRSSNELSSGDSVLRYSF